MLKNYLAVAVRLFVRNRTYTALSVLSLTIALAAALFVARYALHEWSYDRFHDRADDVYRLVTHSQNRDVERSVGFVPLALAPYLEERFAAVEDYARVWEYRRAMPVTNPARDATFYEDDFGWAERSFFDLFSFPIVAGDADDPLRKAQSVVVSASAARTYFGDEDPIGQTLYFRAEVDIPLEVTAVMADFPTTSHLHFDFVANIEAAEQSFWAGGNAQGWLEEWVNLFVGAYVLARPGADLGPALAEATEQVNARLDVTGATYRIDAQPLTSIHLTSALDVGEFGPNGSQRTLLAVLAIGLIILALGSFNFVNLVTAQAGQRLKEVGVRKTMGGTRRQLMLQHYLECALLVGAALVVAVAAVEALRLPLQYLAPTVPLAELLRQPALLAGLGGGVLLLIGLAGAYPALVVARFAPTDVLKRTLPTAASGQGLRRVLVTTQFTLSAALVVCTAVVYGQLQHLKASELGFAEDQLVIIPIHNDGAILPNLGRLKEAYEQDPRVHGVTASSHLMLDEYTYQNTFRLAGEGTPSFRWERYTVEGDYPDVYGLEFVAGRSFRPDAPADSNAVILNARAVRELGLAPEAAVGQRLVNESSGVTGEIVGVVADFHYQSLREAIQPFVLVHEPGQVDYISVKISPEAVPTTLAGLEATWEAVIPEAAFGYYFLDDTFAAAYEQEEHLTRIVLILSAIAVFLACLGLFGLSLHAAARRTKEIGVRKVLGATAWDVVRLLGRDFTWLVLVALAVAFPAAYLLMDAWLADFAYRIEMPLVLFGLAGAGVLGLAWATMAYQALRAALANPVDALRYE